MATNPPRAVWQKFTSVSPTFETNGGSSLYSNFFHTEKHLPFKNLGLTR